MTNFGSSLQAALLVPGTCNILLCGVENHNSVRGTKGTVASPSVNMARHPRGSYIVILIAVSGVVTPENKVTHWRCHPQARKQAQGAGIILTSGSWNHHATRRTPHGASCSVQAMSAWWVKSRRAPSRHRSSRGARVYVMRLRPCKN